MKAIYQSTMLAVEMTVFFALLALLHQAGVLGL
jgi:hypothetical protein